MIRRSQSSWWDIDFKQIAMVALQGAVVLLTIFTISAITVRLMYRSFIPQPLLREKLYFDFRLPSPLASLRLQGAPNQWDYVGALSESHTKYAKPPYLIPGRAYDISLHVVFAKSPRNLDLGKAVFSVTLQDTAGDTIAHSVRTVSYIYRSPYFTFLQDISTFGFELIGLSGYPISLQQQASIMETYVEPSGHPPTHVVNVEISTNEVDVYDAYLIIAPKMSWLISLIYRYPWISSTIGTMLISGFQLWFVVLYVLAKYATSQWTELQQQQQEDARRDFGWDSSVRIRSLSQAQSQLQRSLSREGSRVAVTARNLASDDSGAYDADLPSPPPSPLMEADFQEYFQRTEHALEGDDATETSSDSLEAVIMNGLRQRRKFRVDDLDHSSKM